MNKISSIIINLSAVFVCFLFAAIYTTFFFINDDAIVKIKGGKKLSQIVLDLRKDAVLNVFNEKFFLRYLDGKVRAGHYKIFKGESIFEFAKRVKNGESEMCVITFVPGKTVHYYMQQLNLDDNFYGDILNTPSEGSMLPESYKHKCETSRDVVIKHAQNSMTLFLDSQLAGYDFEKSHLKTPYDILIMASIIEKETSIVEEMPKISSVFRNRMAIGMKLQTDPTVIYQITNETGILERSLTLEDLKSQGVWNTYVIPALPLTPIASPSKEAIYAAIHPLESDLMFFVASGDGGHTFTKTYKEHLIQVDKYRKIRDGK